MEREGMRLRAMEREGMRVRDGARGNESKSESEREIESGRE